MTISPTVWNFPDLPIRGQVFYVPGLVRQGGFTSGGAQFIEPEPGGFGQLDIELALQTNEWNSPDISWLMSKSNGQVLRVRLAPTPQIAWSSRKFASMPPIHDQITSGIVQPVWENDAVATFNASSLEGAVTVTVNLQRFGQILRAGHVIGHEFETYLVENVSYSGTIAALIISPPLRRNVTTGDAMYFRPWFTGRILNGEEIRSMYQASDNGHVKIEKITMVEARIP